MLKIVHRALVSGAAAVAMVTFSALPASAAPTPVAGVIVGGIGETTLIRSSLTEQFVSPTNPFLFGFGKVEEINGQAPNAFCISGSCELTYAFSNYIPVAFTNSGVETGVAFIGGTVDFFLDETPDSSLQTTEGFTDGTPWLSLIGAETTTSTGPNAGLTGTLLSVATDVLDPTRIRGSGDGMLMIAGGPAAEHFGQGNLMSFYSTFKPAPADWELPLSDPADLEIVAQDPATTVPEPGTLSLMVLGLVTLAGFSHLRRNQARPFQN